ncbi:hypothetical protein HanRHA438_Chr10g0440561 [Helianthus annuus]|nr:hypothetical protein HanRHA438_Chr10g0440561 [Helianthus annuus]KAJ0882746.1 hypothetical protein HanPSC8_Chr10g0413251 [Helianthus annuus]
MSNPRVMSDITNKYRCGVFNAVFGRRSRRSASTGSLPVDIDVADFVKTTSNQKSDSLRKGDMFQVSCRF